MIAIAHEPPGQGFDQASGEQRVADDRAAIHRSLIVERRRDDATTLPVAQGIE
jgi:hypothetical protein